ncbi:MAG: NAD(P)/FAD-dependent oxidoreductase [Bacteroidota bacterium]
MSTTSEVVIVGGGLAGLTAARTLAEHRIEFVLLEASDGLGGRVRTDAVDGFLLDRGFQVLLTAYPEAKRWLDYEGLDLQPFDNGALVHYRGTLHRLADPTRDFFGALPSVFSPIGSLADKVKVLGLRQSVRTPSLDDLWARDEVTTREALTKRYGFSETMLSRFFEPFLGGILLDKDLNASSRAFEFYFRMFSEGQTAVPARGMGAIPEQLAAPLPTEAIRLNTPVESVSGGSVALRDATSLRAKTVIVATDGPTAAHLLNGSLDPPASRCVTCAYYAAPAPPIDEPILVLDGENAGPVNNLAVMSNVAAGYAPAGQALIAATVLGLPDADDNLLDLRVRDHCRTWFGAQVDAWTPLRTYRIEHAQPAQAPPALTPPTRPMRLGDGLYLAGDHRTNASINGAMRAGRLAAAAVLADLGVPVQDEAVHR